MPAPSWRLATALAAVLLLPGCLEWAGGILGSETLDPRPAPFDPAIELLTLDQGYYRLDESAERTVIANATAWAAYLLRHYGEHPPLGILPGVDFNRSRVVAVAAGRVPDYCHLLRVTDVARDAAGAETVVTVTTYTPPAGTRCRGPESGAAVPFHLVRIPQDGTRVRFEERQEEGLPRCPGAAGCPIPTPPAPKDLRLLLNATYRVGERAEVRVENRGNATYVFNPDYEACTMRYYDGTGRLFKIPPGTHCDLVSFQPIPPGTTVTLFAWDLTECTVDNWGCSESKPLPPGEYQVQAILRQLAPVAPGEMPRPAAEGEWTGASFRITP
ncbi:MAG TPA: hypothetical protein VNZ52_09315 [Candidatus Thermoplasmatota archaeon]|nr:hypothetical protein [Candidatus Thermoplasmatota archaeon]